MSEILQRSDQDVEGIAAKEGLIAFMPLATEIFLDYDSPWHNDVISKIESILYNNGMELGVRRTKTTSRNGNAHVYIDIGEPLTQLERICLQLALGSDPVKETLSMLRCRMGGERGAVALFETKAEAKRVIDWRRENIRKHTKGGK